MSFYAGGTETMHLVGGRVLIGETSADTDLGGALQVVGDTYGESSILQARTSANQYGPSLDFLKSRNATWGSHTIVQDGDDLGRIYFRGDDGVNYAGAAALIMGEVDGTPGADDMPGRLTFHTSADGSDSPTERLRISSNGKAYFTPSEAGGFEAKWTDVDSAGPFGKFWNSDSVYGGGVQVKNNNARGGLEFLYKDQNTFAIHVQ